MRSVFTGTLFFVMALSLGSCRAYNCGCPMSHYPASEQGGGESMGGAPANPEERALKAPIPTFLNTPVDG